MAIHLNQENPRNYNGPPYSIPENVFDECDMDGCSLVITDFEDKKEKLMKNQKFRDIEDAMMFVSSSGYGENSAMLDKSTGKIYSGYHGFGGGFLNPPKDAEINIFCNQQS